MGVVFPDNLSGGVLPACHVPQRLTPSLHTYPLKSRRGAAGRVPVLFSRGLLTLDDFDPNSLSISQSPPIKR